MLWPRVSFFPNADPPDGAAIAAAEVESRADNGTQTQFAMPTLDGKLDLVRCPHCSVHRPFLNQVWNGQSQNAAGGNPRVWSAYVCGNCGGVVTAWARTSGGDVKEVFPERLTADDALPETARAYLSQAMESLHAPAGAVMLAASAVDAMLKAKGYKDGTLYARIKKAAADHLITEGMAEWAHEVRLDANDQRHADEHAALPTEEEGKRSIEFTRALGQFLYVLPSRIERGMRAGAEH